MQSNLNEALKMIFTVEGGFVNRPIYADPGGATNYGITQKTYNAYLQTNNLTLKNVKNIKREEAELIYRHEYAEKIQFHALPSGIDYFMLDTAIHSGVARAVKLLQSALNISQDGIIGAQTLSAVKQCAKNPAEIEKLLEKLIAIRLRFLKGLSNWNYNAKGWQNRLQFVHKNALAILRKQTLSNNDLFETYSNERGQGKQKLSASIQNSKRSKAAILGGTSLGLGTLCEGINQANLISEKTSALFSWSKYAPLIGTIIAISAFLYIVIHRKNKHD